MKNVRFLIVLGVSLFVLSHLTSCADDFDKVPSDSLSSENPTPNMATFNTAVNGVYSTLVNRYSYVGDYGLYADGKGGDLIAPSRSHNHFLPILQYNTDDVSGISLGVYQRFGYLAARINSVLVAAEKVSDKEENIDAYNNNLGQLYALRALGHFEMARVYAKLPAVAEDMTASNSGIALNDTVYDDSHKFSRATLKETYDFIVADLLRSLTLLSKDKVVSSNKVNYWTAAALLSRVYLYLQDYDNALKYAVEVIDNSPYSLYNTTNYTEVWSSTGTTESLFEVMTTDKSNAQRNSLGYYTSPNGYPEAAASSSFLTFVNERPTDVRTKMVEEKSSAKGAYKAYYTKKYEGQDGASTPLYVNNFKVIRLSEVYLIAAEAKLLGGTYTGAKEAVDYYNTLRENRLTDYTAATSVTIDNILDERRIEFFCENQRMFDLVRHKKSITSELLSETLEYNDYRLLTAIPLREINISGGRIVQNTGW